MIKDNKTKILNFINKHIFGSLINKQELCKIFYLNRVALSSAFNYNNYIFLVV